MTDVERLLQEIETLDQRLRALLRALEIEREQQAERAGTVPRVTAGRESFAIRSGDGNFSMKFRGYVHADGRFFVDGADPAVPDTFLMRRVRPVVEATIFGAFDFQVTPDFGAVLQVANRRTERDLLTRVQFAF